MDSGPPTRSFIPLACSLLIVSFAVCGAGALARKRDSAVAVAELRTVIPAAVPAFLEAPIDGRQVLVNSWHINGFAPPGRAAPIGAAVAPIDDDQSPALQNALRLQQDLFTRGGSLAPIDLLIADEAMALPTERTRKVPDWAAQLRAARTEQEKVGG